MVDQGGRSGHDLLSFPGVRLVLPQDGRAVATTRNAVNGRSETGRNGQAIEPRVVVQGYRLGRIWDLREGESRLEFRDRTTAAGFLQRLATDPCVLATLRSTHAGVGASSAIHRLGDRVVLDQLAGHLVDRSLEVVVEYHLLPSVTTAAYGPPAVPEVSRPPDDRPAVLTFPTLTRRREPAPPEKDPLVSAMEIRQQVETLRRAARDGIPFCERCRKDKSTRRPPAPAGASK